MPKKERECIKAGFRLGFGKIMQLATTAWLYLGSQGAPNTSQQ